MTDEHKPGEPLGNARHERFAQAIVAGMTATDAHENAGYARNDGNASTLKGNERVSDRIDELLEKAASVAVDLNSITAEMVIGGILDKALNSKSDGASVAAWKLLGQSNVIGLFVPEDENRKPKTAPEVARAIAGDDDEFYRMILTRIPLAPSEKQ